MVTDGAEHKESLNEWPAPGKCGDWDTPQILMFSFITNVKSNGVQQMAVLLAKTLNPNKISYSSLRWIATFHHVSDYIFACILFSKSAGFKPKFLRKYLRFSSVTCLLVESVGLA